MKTYFIEDLQVAALKNNDKVIKNILGVSVLNNGENYFYSIYDDCFFNIKDSELEAKVIIPDYGKKLQQKFLNLLAEGKRALTKEEIIDNPIINFHCYFSDLDNYEYFENIVDYSDPNLLKGNLIVTIKDYENRNYGFKRVLK